MPDTVIDHNPAPVAPPAAAPPAAAPPAETGVTKEEFEALKAERDEQKRAAEFWYTKATGSAEKAPPKKDEEEEPDADLLDIITTRGAKGFESYMKSRGFVSRKEVDALVNSRAAQFQIEQDLFKDYPDLKDSNSDFFKLTAEEYGKLKAEGVPESVAMRAAADRIHLAQLKSGKVKTPAQQKDDEKAEREAARKARAAAQAGDKGTRQSEPEEGDEELDPDQKRIIAGMGITEEAYKKRAKEGVRVSVRMAR